MKTSFWLKIEAKKERFGGYSAGKVEAKKSKPNTGLNEVAVKVEFEIPDSYFEVPEIQVTLVVPEDAVNKPKITPKMQTNIGELIKDQLGCKVTISLPQEEQK